MFHVLTFMLPASCRMFFDSKYGADSVPNWMRSHVQAISSLNRHPKKALFVSRGLERAKGLIFVAAAGASGARHPPARQGEPRGHAADASALPEAASRPFLQCRRHRFSSGLGLGEANRR